MMRVDGKSGIVVACGLAFGAMLGVAAPAWAGPPTDAVRKSVDEVIRILEDPAWKKPEKKEERRKLLEKTIAQRFKFLEMSRRSLGAEWNKRTPEEQKDFAASFQTLLANTYLGRIENYTGEKVQYFKEIVDGEYADVYTKIDNGKTALDIMYKMEMTSGDWRVYDVVVEGTGLVQNYREQFKRILRKDSFAELTKQLREKAEHIKTPGPSGGDSARSR